MRTRRGLTIVEVIVALAVLAIIGTLAFSTLASTIGVQESIELAGGSRRTARTALGTITRQLQLAHMTKNVTAVNTYKTVFVGKDDDDEDTLWFATLGHKRRFRDSRECDQGEVTLFTEEDPEHSKHMVLFHRAGPRIDHEPDQDGPILPLARGVTRFDLKYLDPRTGEWKEEWDSTGGETPGMLPRAVQIVLGLASPHPEEEGEFQESTYVRTVMLAMANPQTQSVFSRGMK
jgi:general secretion pathway protein J